MGNSKNVPPKPSNNRENEVPIHKGMARFTFRRSSKRAPVNPNVLESRNRRHNIIRYLVLTFVALCYAYFFGGLFPYTLLYMMLALPLMSALHLIMVLAMFRFSERLNQRVFVKGECASYRLLLQNPTFLYLPYITVEMQLEGQFLSKELKSMSLSLAPFQNKEFKYNLPLPYRGRYDIGVKAIKIQDILGFFNFSIKTKEKKSILVKPRVRLLAYKDVPVANISEGFLASGYLEAGNDEMRDIREYVYGDSFRKIHWKLSSKLAKTLVKDTRNELDNDVLVILNLNKPETPDVTSIMKEDCLIEECVSLINYLLRRNVSVKFCFYDLEPHWIRASTPPEFETVYQLLAEVKFNYQYEFGAVMDYFVETEKNSNLAYIFSSTIDGDIINHSFDMRNKEFEVELYYIDIKGIAEGDARAQDDLAEMLAQNNVKASRLKPEIMSFNPTGEVQGREPARNGVNINETRVG